MGTMAGRRVGAVGVTIGLGGFALRPQAANPITATSIVEQTPHFIGRL